MCGIAGIFAYANSSSPTSGEELMRMHNSMRMRGPDGEGQWTSPDGRAALAHRRLAIIDLGDSGAQPMATVDGRLQITFNGEIYNYRELRRELQGRGFVFRSDSDTEVLLHLYADRGADMVRCLKGMYAFAIWDQTKRGLLLARDPFGIKPLYFANDGKTFRFASQVKALLAGRAISLEEQPAGYAGFLLWGFVPEPFTLYRSINSLPAGSTLWVGQDGAGPISQFFRVRDEILAIQESAPSLKVVDLEEVLQEAVRESVRRHMVADVPVGTFLSAGLDSTLIAAHAVEHTGQDLNTLTLGFDKYRGSQNDETILAAAFATTIGSKHQTCWISREDILDTLESVFHAMDQPTTDGLNTYLVSRAASAAGMKVALSGLGGDELFAGYPSFEDVPRISRTMRRLPNMPRAGRAVRRMVSPLISSFASPKFAGILEYGRDLPGAYLLRRALFMPWELERSLDPQMVKEGLQTLETLPRLASSAHGIGRESLKVSSLEMEWYMRGQLLRDADWAGMAHSLEIRVPFVDLDMFRAVTGLVLAGWTPNKSDVMRACRKELPKEMMQRPKTGFTVPLREWVIQNRSEAKLGSGLRPWALRVLRELGQMRRYFFVTTEAHGGLGGVAEYGRHVVEALTEDPATNHVTVMPRLIREALSDVPPKAHYIAGAAGGKKRFLMSLLRVLFSAQRVDAIVCGHIHLLPVAWLLSRRFRKPLVLFIYGIDAWLRPRWYVTDFFLRDSVRVISISEMTKARFAAWAPLPLERISVIHGAVHLERFSPGPRCRALQERYGITEKKVMMTLGRMDSLERYKGFDEVIEALGSMASSIPDLKYLACGDGTDRLRLQAKVFDLGLSDRVVFTGFIPEEEKAAHYRLADAFVMPSRGEGLGLVMIESVASGVPTVGSLTDGGKEALRDGALGILVNPEDPDDVKRGITRALAISPGDVPAELDYFAFPNFCRRLQRAISAALRAPGLP